MGARVFPSFFRALLPALLAILLGGAGVPSACRTSGGGIAAAQDAPQVEPAAGGQAAGGREAAAAEAPAARLIELELPLSGDTDLQVRQQIERFLQDAPADPRPVVVLEFRGGGEGSNFERCLSLARYLVSAPASRARIVGFVPESVKGHAVLVLMACEEIVMHGDAELGEAGVDEGGVVDETIRQAYADIAQRRLTIPPVLAAAMLERGHEVYFEEALDGTRFVYAEDRDPSVTVVDKIVSPGDMARIDGTRLRLKYHVIAALAEDRRALAAYLEVPPAGLRADPLGAAGPRPVQAALRGRVSSKQVNQILRGLQAQIRAGANTVVLRIDSSGGSLQDSLELASYLVELRKSEVRTIGFVEGQALADAGLVALACDELVMAADAELGGPGETHFRRETLRSARDPIQRLGEELSRDWSPLAAVVDPELPLYRYRRGNQQRLLCSEEHQSLDDEAAWEQGEVVPIQQGLSAPTAVELGLARETVAGVEQLWALYHFETPPLLVRENWAVSRLESLAAQPWFANVLLFAAFFALMSEASAPGVGVPGFIAAVCFLLFFWVKFLDGTADWLEVLLFVGGVACVLVEIFVLPGLGIFGVGGVAMVLAAIMLASQTFLLPQNLYQWKRLSLSVFSAVWALAGALSALAAVRYFLPQTPFFRHLMLATADPKLQGELAARESLAHYDHLVGREGTTATRLAPSGKARFGDEVVPVISSGPLVPAGTAIRVTRVQGNRVVVRPVA